MSPYRNGNMSINSDMIFNSTQNTKFKRRTKSKSLRNKFSLQFCDSLTLSSFSTMLYINLCFVLLLLVKNSDGFNLDVSTRVEIVGNNPGSYFGYSVAMLNKPPSEKWILVGAPKDNSSNMPNTINSGAVYKVTVLSEGQGHSTNEIYIDDDLNGLDVETSTYNGASRLYVNGRDNQWLGESLDVHPDSGIITCASRWFNRYFESEDYYFMNGICYQLPVDMNRDNIVKIPALINKTMQTTTFPGNVTKINYGMGSLGSSVHFTELGQDLLLGTPGLRTWTGGFIDLRRGTGLITDYVGQATEISELAGYAMTSGNYFGNGLTYFAISAPREELTGKVFVYRGNQPNFVYENKDAELNGGESSVVGFMPVNAYFGAALASTDVNNDGNDDLLVGAPFYSMDSSEEHASMEEGLVMVYLGSSNFRFEVQSQPLRGSKAMGARFGTAISTLGDINKDNYNDVIIGAPYEDDLQGAVYIYNGCKTDVSPQYTQHVIIGAPYEDDLQGAVYIYNGCKTGVWPQYTQRIAASEMATGLKSFGISLSRPADMNEDNVNDIAIGAYMSDKAFLLYGQSVINIDISLGTTVDLIDKDTPTTCTLSDGSDAPCFGVEVCFSYDNRQYGTIDISFTVKLDTYMDEFPRLVWQSSSTNMYTESNFRIFSGDRMCSDVLFALIKSTSDLVTPVMIKADYSVVDIQTNNYVKPTLNKFSGDSPNKNIMEATYLIDFKKQCPNNNCQTNLQVQADLEYDKLDDANYFVIGTPMLKLHVSITKTGDPSYASNMFITMPKSIQYQKVTQIYGDTEVNCGFVEEGEEVSDQTGDDSDEADTTGRLHNIYIPEKSEDELMLICSFGNPMVNDTGVKFHVNFVVPQSITDRELKFHLNATTLSTETAAYDNEETLTMKVKNKVATSFIGVSRPSYVTVGEAINEYKVSHVYELSNRGPSPLPSASMTLQYPQVQSGGQAQLYLNRTTWSCQRPCEVSCIFMNTGGSPTVYDVEVGPTYYVNESPTKERIGQSVELTDIQNTDCTQTPCAPYECELKNVPPGESAVVSLEFVVSSSILSLYSENQVVTIRSDAYVRFNEQNRLVAEQTEHNTDVLTDIYPLAPPPKSVPWWVYLVSILGGVILIAVIVLICWKVGFFKRKDMEQLKLMQHSGEVEKMVPQEEVNGTEKA